MKKNYIIPAIKVQAILVDELLAASVYGSSVSEEEVPSGVTGFSKENTITPTSVWGDDEE